MVPGRARKEVLLAFVQAGLFEFLSLPIWYEKDAKNLFRFPDTYLEAR